MKFQHRSFRGDDCTIPSPEIYFEPQERLLIVATPWGNPKGARKVVESLADFYLSARTDREATSPFRRLEFLSPIANNLRIAGLIANERLYRESNKTEYTTGVEVFAAALFEKELAWLQVGQPHVFLKRQGQSLLPLSIQLNLASEIQAGQKPLPPLPKNMLGIAPEPNLHIQSFTPQAEDALVLLSREWVPHEMFTAGTHDPTMETLSRVIGRFNETPFWLGYFSI